MLRPYARKFANVYAQAVDVAAVISDEVTVWNLTVNNALTQYGASVFNGNTSLYGTLTAYNLVKFANLEILYGLLVRGVSTFTAAVTFQRRVNLPAATYLNGSLLVELAVNITSCYVEIDSYWVVVTDNTGSAFKNLRAADRAHAHKSSMQGVLDKLSVAEVPGLRTYEPSTDDFERAKTAVTSRFSNGRL
ncbi:hypothetical protein T492DRAFT_885400 [Pavlovales sp. CCMP2436]|nr:hypothetical protein T492DRAFT_885400 [Pavlovales sp. CCMP2436]